MDIVGTPFLTSVVRFMVFPVEQAFLHNSSSHVRAIEKLCNVADCNINPHLGVSRAQAPAST